MSLEDRLSSRDLVYKWFAYGKSANCNPKSVFEQFNFLYFSKQKDRHSHIDEMSCGENYYDWADKFHRYIRRYYNIDLSKSEKELKNHYNNR